MPFDKQISNPAGSFGLTADPSCQIIVEAINNSGGTLIEGDVVVMTDVNGLQITTTTTASHTSVIGVVGPGASTAPALGAGGGPGAIGSAVAAAANTATYAASANVPVVVYGPARINIAANTVAAQAYVATSAVAKVAAVPATAGSVGALQALVGSFIAVAQESQASKDASNTIRCFVKCS